MPTNQEITVPADATPSRKITSYYCDALPSPSTLLPLPLDVEVMGKSPRRIRY
jgi:hypothetical protein